MSVKYRTTTDWVEEQLKQWRDLINLPQPYSRFSWMGEEELGETHILAFSGGRDASLLQQSNFEIINKDMQERFPDDVGDVGMGHGRDIKWDQMLVRVKDEKGQLTEAAYALEDWYLKLEDYPVADENHYSNLQYESDLSHIRAHYVNKNFCDTSTLPDDWESRVYSDLDSVGADCTGEGFTDAEINDALWALGYTKFYACPHCDAAWAAKYIDDEWYMVSAVDGEWPGWGEYWEITERDPHFQLYMREIEEHRAKVAAQQAMGTTLFGDEYEEPHAPQLEDADGLVVVVIDLKAICPVCLIGEFDV